MKDLQIDEHNNNDITKANKLIAEFMEIPKQDKSNGGKFYLYEHPQTGEYVEPELFAYEASWDWLMNVVHKIIEICREPGNEHLEDSDHYVSIIDTIPCCIEDAYKVVVEFIEWYNENNK